MARRAKPHTKVKAERRVLSPDEKWAAELEAKMLAACHPWQEDAVKDPSRRVSLLVGRGGGKTTALRVRGVRKCVRKRKARILYFAKTRLHAKDLMWYPLKDLCENLGLESGKDVLFNETELRCTFVRTGSVYQLSGASDLSEIEKWRGQSFDEVQIDEGASHKTELLDVLLYRIVGPRLGDRDGCIVIAGSPGHHLTGTFYDVTRPGSDKHRPFHNRELELVAYDARVEGRDAEVAAIRAEDDAARTPPPPKGWSSHWWTLEMVCSLPDAERRFPALVKLWAEALVEFAENLWGPDNPIRKREYGAIWAADHTTSIFQYRPRLEDGTPWNEWEPEIVEIAGIKIAKLPNGPDGKPITDWLHVFVSDHGAGDPFAFNVYSASPSDQTRTIYHTYWFEQPHMYARRIAILMLGPMAEEDIDAAHEKPQGVVGAFGWPAGAVTDIKALGENITDELSHVYGIRFLPADQDGKFGGIELVNSDLVDGRIKVLKGSPLASQLAELQWQLDEYGRRKENKAQPNHSSDTLIYGRRELANVFDKIGNKDQKQKPKRDPFADPMGLDAADPDHGAPGEFDILFRDNFGDIQF